MFEKGNHLTFKHALNIHKGNVTKTYLPTPQIKNKIIN